MKYYIMMIDGRCTSTIKNSKIDAFSYVAKYFGYEEFDDFLNDVNICEWKDDVNRVVEWYSPNGIKSEIYDPTSDYQLSEYCQSNLQNEQNDLKIAFIPAGYAV